MAKAAIVTRDEQSGMGGLAQFSARTKGFFADVRNEVRKVTFPSRKEVQATTVVVIVTVAVFAAYFWVIDLVVGGGVQWLLQRTR
jgi:preprotein translocase subunit SecE